MKSKTSLNVSCHIFSILPTLHVLHIFKKVNQNEKKRGKTEIEHKYNQKNSTTTYKLILQPLKEKTDFRKFDNTQIGYPVQDIV